MDFDRSELSLRSSIDNLGYAVIDGILSNTECRRIKRRLEGLNVDHGRAGMRHLMSDETIYKVSCDPRLLQLARSASGTQMTPFRTTLLSKTPKANWLVTWHQDTALPLKEKSNTSGWGPWSIKAQVNYAHAPAETLEKVLAIRVHLDESTTMNGPLRIIPGSHKRGVLTDQELTSLSDERTPAVCEVGRGGVLLMRPLLVHASSKSTSNRRRRVLHIEYIDSLRLSDGVSIKVC